MIMNSKKYTSIGNRLKAVRLAFFPDTTISRYADLMGFNYTRYLNWESGLNRPQPDEAVIFCDKFGITLDFIYLGREFALSQSALMVLSGIPAHKNQSISNDNPD